MSETKKMIAERCAAAICKMPEAQAMYLLGRAECQADMAEEKQKEVEKEA